jgi:glycerate dehydrogenase
MKIVVLDGYTLNPGDLSWGELESLGTCEIFDRTPKDMIVARAHSAEIVMTNKTVLDAATLAQLPELRFIGVLATGYNVVDLAAAKRQGIIVSNIPAYGTPAVAQMVFAHILNLTHLVGEHAATVRAGDWSRCEDFCYWRGSLIELQGRTLGIIGLGRIGGQVARVAKAFDMEVITYSQPPPAAGSGIESVGIAELFKRSDIISLHCPLTPETEKIVNVEHLAMMKPTALLVNTSRGPLIDEPALAAALNSGGLAGAGLDVLSVEPPAAGNPLLTAKNCYVTPHIAWATRDARARLLGVAVDNVLNFQANKPQNVVNP